MPVSGRPSANKKSRNLYDEFVARRLEKDDGVTKNEVDKYLEEEPEQPTENFDVLGWWASSECKYKILSLMARVVLAILVTFEATFSIGGQIIDHFRSSLSPRMVEALICLNNWWSRSHQPIITREYMEEEEALQTSEYLESSNLLHFIWIFMV